jgi:hypothetical protein
MPDRACVGSARATCRSSWVAVPHGTPAHDTRHHHTPQQAQTHLDELGLCILAPDVLWVCDVVPHILLARARDARNQPAAALLAVLLAWTTAVDVQVPAEAAAAAAAAAAGGGWPGAGRCCC